MSKSGEPVASRTLAMSSLTLTMTSSLKKFTMAMPALVNVCRVQYGNGDRLDYGRGHDAHLYSPPSK